MKNGSDNDGSFKDGQVEEEESNKNLGSVPRHAVSEQTTLVASNSKLSEEELPPRIAEICASTASDSDGDVLLVGDEEQNETRMPSDGGNRRIPSSSHLDQHADEKDKEHLSPPPLQEQGGLSNGEADGGVDEAGTSTTQLISKRISIGRQQLRVTSATVSTHEDSTSYYDGCEQSETSLGGLEEGEIDDDAKSILIGAEQVAVSTTTVLDHNKDSSATLSVSTTSELQNNESANHSAENHVTFEEGRNDDHPPVPQFLNRVNRPGAYLVQGRSIERQRTGFISPCLEDQASVQTEFGFTSAVEQGATSTMGRFINGEETANRTEENVDSMHVTATALDESELETRLRQEMMRDAVHGEIVEMTNQQHKMRRTHVALYVLFALVFIGVIIGLSVRLTKSGQTTDQESSISDTKTLSPTASPTETLMPTLEQLKGRGKLNCGVSENHRGFYQINSETGVGVGFQFDLCRAVAAAIFGDSNPDRVSAMVTKGSERFIDLEDRTIDLLARSPTHTMERDVYLESTGTGFSFATPYLYDGLGFAGTPPYGACADNLLSYAGDCRKVRVCVQNQSSHVPVVRHLLPEPFIVLQEDPIEGFIKKSCNAMAGEKFMIAEDVVRSRGYNGEYEIGENTYSKEHLGLATRDDDVQWSDFVNLIMQVLFAAEAQGVTQNTASNLSTTPVFGKEFESMFINAVAAVGNYGEIYERHLEEIVPRENVNRISTDGNTGLFLSDSFGLVHSAGPGPTKDSTLGTIAFRGHLRCGVTPREGFADFDPNTKAWIGLDVDFCYALASSIFNRTTTDVVFVNLTKTETFSSLAHGSIDILAGASVSVLTEVMEHSSGQGFSFSQPYFYDPPTGVVDNIVTRALATRQDDAQWSSFVYWIVASSFYAEEIYVTRSTFAKMPIVNLFGPAYAGMFQNAIFAVGNSKEMYERNLESLIPRSGRNQVNKNPLGPQHFPLPGI